MKSLKEIEEKYEGVLNQVLSTEEEKFKDWEACSEKAIKSLEFEKEVYLTLVDVLYTTKGKWIYSDIIKNSGEFGYIESVVNKSTSKDLRLLLKKAFHVNFSDIDYNEASYGQRIFCKLSTKELKEFLINRKLPDFQSSMLDESFPGSIAIDEGNWIIATIKTDKKGSLKERLSDRLVVEFVLIISWLSAADSIIYQEMNEDERVVEVISDCHNLPAESVAMIKNLEREIFEKFADHERRIWGELEPNALSKYKIQQDELTKLHSSLQNLKTKIDDERNTQERILREMRETLIGPGGTKLY